MSMTPSRAKNAIGRSLSQIIFGYPTTSDKRQIWQYFNHRCAYCDCQITERSGHLDHLIPISDGGTNHKHNFVLACRHCNGDEKREQDWVLFLTLKCQNLPKSVFQKRYEKIQSWYNQKDCQIMDLRIQQEMNNIINQAKQDFDNAVAKMRELKKGIK
ncbi:HNH endonuclease [Moraxella bovoculi]|uniref:HNH endonuclease n=1 Tax=Moraxella bovoculi TaxID=386891 RepID=UPI003F504CAA